MVEPVPGLRRTPLRAFIVTSVVAAVIGAAGAAGGQTASSEVCATIGERFVYFGGTPASVTVPIGPIIGSVESVTVVVNDTSHPDGASQPSERVTISLGADVIGTTPDLADAETGATHVLPVGADVDVDSLTVTHAPEAGPDSINVVSVCVSLAPPQPTTTTSAPSTTTSTTTTSTLPPTPVVPAPPSSTTTTEPPVPGAGSFAASCSAAGAPDLAALVWTAQGVLPSTITSGELATLAQQQWSVSIPASIFDQAIDLGLVVPGDVVPVSIGASIHADGTDEGTQTVSGLASSVVVAVNEDGTAQPAVAVVSAPDMVFTPNADRIEVRLAAGTAELDLGLGEPVRFTCAFGDEEPPFVSSPPTEVAGPPEELAFTGVSTYLWAALIVFVLVDVGYLLWSAGRPERRRVS